MATLSELKTMQAEAGAAYAAAAEAYRAAWAELHALDLTLANGNVEGDNAGPTFNRHPEVLTHPVYYPTRCDALTDKAWRARHDQLLRQYTPG